MAQQDFQWISDLAQTKISWDSFLTNIPPDAALTAKFATVSNVSDPLSLGILASLLAGLAKLTYESENNSFETSNWCYVAGHPGGNLSTDFIGQKCIVCFESGDQNNAVVLGFIPVAGKRAIGNPVKIPIIPLENNSPNGKIPKCNESNLGSLAGTNIVSL